MIPVVPLEPVGKHTSPTIPIVAVTQALDIRVWVNIVLQSILGERLQGVPFNNHPVIMLTIILENVPTHVAVPMALSPPGFLVCGQPPQQAVLISAK